LDSPCLIVRDATSPRLLFDGTGGKPRDRHRLGKAPRSHRRGAAPFSPTVPPDSPATGPMPPARTRYEPSISFGAAIIRCLDLGGAGGTAPIIAPSCRATLLRSHCGACPVERMSIKSRRSIDPTPFAWTVGEVDGA